MVLLFFYEFSCQIILHMFDNIPYIEYNKIILRGKEEESYGRK